MTSPLDQPTPSTLVETSSQLRFFAEHPDVIKNASLPDVTKFFRHTATLVQRHVDDGKTTVATFEAKEDALAVAHSARDVNNSRLERYSRLNRLWEGFYSCFEEWIDDGQHGFLWLQKATTSSLGDKLPRARKKFDDLVKEKPSRAGRLWEQLSPTLERYFESQQEPSSTSEEESAEETVLGPITPAPTEPTPEPSSRVLGKRRATDTLDPYTNAPVTPEEAHIHWSKIGLQAQKTFKENAEAAGVWKPEGKASLWPLDKRLPLLYYEQNPPPAPLPARQIEAIARGGPVPTHPHQPVPAPSSEEEL
jgi:hypothetical protein